MGFLRNLKNINKSDKFLAGGKGASLGILIKNDFSVPPGFVVLTTAFEEFLERENLNITIKSILQPLDQNKTREVERASKKIRMLILGREIPVALEKEIYKFFKKLDTQSVAVRSSATAEDGHDSSWAGQLESYLNTTEENLLENIKKCWASLFSPRAIFYQLEKGLDKKEISVAVVVQKMINSEKSGVVFSVHPVTQNKNQLIIEAGFGPGESIVAGRVTPDSYVVEKKSKRIIDLDVVTNGKQVLSETEILELSEIVLKIEDQNNFPVDIEWVFEKGIFYIVQARPITTLSRGSELKKYKYQPRSKDYTFYFEAQKVTPLFQEIISRSYMPPGSVQLCPLGNVRSFISKDALKKTHEIGADFFSDEETVITTIKRINTLIKEAKTLTEEHGRAQKISVKEAKEIFDLMEKIHEEYAKISFEYTDGAYKKFEGITPILELVDKHKNKIREKYNELFFVYGEGGFVNFLATIAETHNLTIDDLAWCRKSEIFSILKGRRLPKTKIQKRKKAYVFYKDQDEHINFFEGKEAQRFIENFEDRIPLDSRKIKGKVAHSTGKKVKGKVVIIDSNYLDFEETKERMEKMEKGQVLVSVTTAPDLMPALRKAAAVITDVGGMLSHAAITARELNIPCVVGTEYASKTLRDGDEIEIDTETGIIKRL